MNGPNVDFSEWNDRFVSRYRSSRLRDPEEIDLPTRLGAFRSGAVPEEFADTVPIPPALPLGWRIVRGCLWTTALGGIGLVAMGVVAIWLSGSASEPSTNEQPPLESANAAKPPFQGQLVYSVSAEYLASAFQDNEVAANAKYANQYIEVSGVIKAVRDNPPTIELATTADLLRNVNTVDCQFDNSWRPYLAKLSPGSSIRIRGTVIGAMNGLWPRLSRCSFD